MNQTSINAAIKVPAAAPLRIYKTVVKRVVDLVLAFALLPVFLPIIVGLCIVVRRDGGRGFFGHTRVGKDGREFKCWKIRTMVVDSEERLKAILESDPEARDEWEKDRKLRNDPRVTKLGSFLRRSSLDELPQLFNVIKGEMSLVGPRPVPRSELALYGSRSDTYLAIRPGVTGLWQVSGRNEVTYDERISMDVQYLRDLSFTNDFKILVKTAGVVLKKTGC